MVFLCDAALVVRCGPDADVVVVVHKQIGMVIERFGDVCDVIHKRNGLCKIFKCEIFFQSVVCGLPGHMECIVRISVCDVHGLTADGDSRTLPASGVEQPGSSQGS